MSRPRLFVVLSALFVFASSSNLIAQESGTARVSVRDSLFLVQPPNSIEQNEVSFTTDYDRRFDLSERWSFNFHPYLYGTTVKDRREQQVVLDPRSFYLEYSRSPIWLRAGFMTLKWEGTDGLNPMDIASMKDWSDPLNQESRASGAFAVGSSGESYDFEAEYIPYQTLWLLPGTKSPWLPRRFNFPLRTNAFSLQLPDQVDYRFDEPTEFENARRSNVASRLQIRSSLADIALGFYQGLADTPAIEPALDVTVVKATPPQVFLLTNPVHVQPVAYRVRTAAGSLSRTLGAWIFRAATRYDQPLGNDSRIPEWSQSSVVGVERSFQIGEQTWTGVLQGAWVRAPESASLLSVKDVFNQTVLFGLRAPLSETLSAMLSGFKATRDSSYYAKLELGYRYNDHWRIDGNLELLDGPPETLLGVFGANDRAMVSLSGVY